MNTCKVHVEKNPNTSFIQKSPISNKNIYYKKYEYGTFFWPFSLFPIYSFESRTWLKSMHLINKWRIAEVENLDYVHVSM